MNTRLFVVTALLLVGAAPAAAAYCEYNDWDCQNREAQKKAADDAWYEEQDRARQVEREQLRRALLKQPPLPAERNGLLGSWRLDDGPQGQTAAILGQVTAGGPGADSGLDGLLRELSSMAMSVEKAVCEAGSGSGIAFSPATYSIHGEIPVVYRAGLLGGRPAIVAIPGDSAQDMMIFAIASPDRIVGEDGCILVRVGAPAGDSSATATTGSSAAPAALAAAVPFRSIKEQLGVDTVASVERDIKARGGSPGSIRAGSQGIATLSTMSGDYNDIGPYVTAVNYDFDGTGSAARLVAVTVVHSFGVFGDAYKKVAEERKAILAKDFGALQMKSATEYSSAAGGYELTLFEKPDTGFFYERYQLAR